MNAQTLRITTAADINVSRLPTPELLALLKRTFAELERRDAFDGMDDEFVAYAEAQDTFTHECGERLEWRQANPVVPFVGTYAEWLV